MYPPILPPPPMLPHILPPPLPNSTPPHSITTPSPILTPPPPILPPPNLYRVQRVTADFYATLPLVTQHI